ncbi:nickel transporter [Mixta theicola]|uniref:Nickel/cobalt efflux system n=1 Tax=Mixta theicola TaxID=1458355 RepID=A0A2K1Q8P2_9GAMM|nr:nickel/cobalt transporter [Mixta theicola]PNS11400.1 nickel transporter [Mixta theicola]GLR10447.1 nickel/cobalt efflux system [Mixta theicola]
MSVILPPDYPRWHRLWPLWSVLALALLAALAAWWYWPQLLWQSVIWQKSLHQQMTGLLQQVAQQPHQAGLALLGFSLMYGILHALGPGHGKVVIATFLATHPVRLKTSLRLTLAAAIVQGAVAVALVTVMLVILQTSSRQLHLSSYWLEKGSYLLVTALGVWLCWRALRQLGRNGALRIQQLRPLDHQHNEHCGCGHQHLPDNQQLARATGWKISLLVVLSMGLRPCSGAIMMLLFSRVIGVYAWGVLSALAMALGTALTVSMMALLVQSSRTLALRLNRRAAPAPWQRVALHSLALAGGLLLIIGGIILWLSAQPAISGGLRALR